MLLCNVVIINSLERQLVNRVCDRVVLLNRKVTWMDELCGKNLNPFNGVYKPYVIEWSEVHDRVNNL